MLRNMRAAVAEANSLFPSTVGKQMSGMERRRLTEMLPSYKKIEMVGLVPKGVDFTFLGSGPSAVDASVLAVSLFERDTLRDDARQSLVTKIREAGYVDVQTRFWWGGTKKKIKAFKLLGLVDAPGVPEHTARALLAKIRRYADEEAAIVVVPTWAYYSREGKDLTEYYVQLGFENVQMEGRLPELVYTGSPLEGPDMLVDDEQIMIGMNLWTSVPR